MNCDNEVNTKILTIDDYILPGNRYKMPQISTHSKLCTYMCVHAYVCRQVKINKCRMDVSRDPNKA